MPTIQDWRLKIKFLTELAIGEWGLIAIVFLLGLTSFALGRFSALEEVKPPVAITQAPLSGKPAMLAMGGLYVASSGGSVYYYPWCSGAGKITPARQVWFTSEAAARQAGYAPSKACKGLEK